jgi:hypothetical protein
MEVSVMPLYRMKVSCYFEIELEADDNKSAAFSVENDYLKNLVKFEVPGSSQSIVVKEVKKIKD